MNSKYFHYVASVQVAAGDVRRVSGAIKVGEFNTPDQTHSQIQINACKKLSLDVDDYQFDVVVEQMNTIE